jgi:hypothetical protein
LKRPQQLGLTWKISAKRLLNCGESGALPPFSNFAGIGPTLDRHICQEDIAMGAVALRTFFSIN